MNCEQCLLELGAYADGELERDTAHRVAEHLHACAACVAAHETFKRGHVAYSFYRRDIDIDEFTPRLWGAVQASSVPERTAATASHAPSLVSRLFAFTRAPRFVPAAAGALALIIFTVLVGLPRFDSAGQPPPPAESAARTEHADAPKDSVASAVAPSPTLVAQATILPAPSPANAGSRSTRNAPVVSGQSRTQRAQRRDGTTVVAGRRGDAAGLVAYTPVAEARLFEGTQSGEPWTEPRKHFERSELLLRAVRNREFALGAGLDDFAYEKQQSRQLLKQNIALRRDAAARGNLLEEALLNDLEAILQDIAGLPAQPSRDDIHSIKRHIGRSEIVADLQIYVAQTTTSPAGY